RRSASYCASSAAPRCRVTCSARRSLPLMSNDCSAQQPSKRLRLRSSGPRLQISSHGVPNTDRLHRPHARPDAHMQPVSLLLNVLGIFLGGAWMAFGWLVAAVVMAITIVGLPWARAAFNIAAYTLLPFGSKAVRRDEITGESDIGTGPLGVIGNLIWLV